MINVYYFYTIIENILNSYLQNVFHDAIESFLHT